MTVTSGFFNSVNHDRLYDAEQVSSMFDGIIIDGVYENYGEALNVTAYSGANSTVIVGTGRAWFDHTWTLNDSQFSITLDPPNELLGRTDSIVIDIDKTQSVRKNSIIYVKGSESTPDLPPTLINTDLHKQYPICYVNRPAGSNKPVTQSDITITVGTSVCPMVTGILEAQNLENLMQQLNDEFNTWWDGVKATLDENTVTNLQNQINEINERLNSDSALVGLLEKPIAEAFMSGDYGINISNKILSDSAGYGYMSIMDNNANIKAPETMILPDGKILCIRHRAEGQGSSKTAYILRVVIFDKNDIQQSYEYTINRSTSTTSFSGEKSFTYWDNWANKNKTIEMNGAAFLNSFFGNYDCVMPVIPLITDVYPVRLSVVYMHTRGLLKASAEGSTTTNSSTCAQWIPCVKLDVTVTSDGVVSFGIPTIVNSKLVQIDDSGTLSPSGYDNFFHNGRGSYTSDVCPTVSYKVGNAYYFPSMAYNYASGSRNMLYACVAKITDDGVLSIGNLQKSQNNYFSTSVNINEMNYNHVVTDSYNDEPVMVVSDGYGFPIDTANLQIRPDESGYTYIPKKVNYSGKAFTLSEKQGVEETSLVLGSAGSQSNVKKSNFFVGASNANMSIPNGSFVGQVVDDRLYGVETSSGHYVAIGTNGGCAILNSTLSGVSNINLTKLQYVYKGYSELDDQMVYLFSVSLDTYVSGNLGSVIRIKRE